MTVILYLITLNDKKNLKNFKTKKSFIQQSTIKGLLIGHGKAGQKVAPGPVQWPFNCFFIVLLCPAGGGRRANVPKKALNQTASQSLNRDRPLLNKPNFNWSPTGGSTKKFCTWMARLQWVFQVKRNVRRPSTTTSPELVQQQRVTEDPPRAVGDLVCDQLTHWPSFAPWAPNCSAPQIR